MLNRRISRVWANLPSQCRICHTWPSQPVCDACVARFAQPVPRCATCSLPLPEGCRQCGACLVTSPPLDQCLAAVGYAYPWSRLIRDYKFHAQPGLARSLAMLWWATPSIKPAIDDADLLIPMPLTAQRLRERGYNQATLLAFQLSRFKTHSDLLIRVQDTPAQHTLGREQRLTMLRNAFTMEVDLPLGSRVVLVDDVMTTGASLHSAARVLRAAGASHITGLVIARTE